MILPILSGLLLFLSYPPQNLWFLVFLALVPLFWFLFSEKTSDKQAFWGSLISGFIFIGGLFVWLFYTAPFEWLGVTTRKGFVGTLILMIVLWIFQVFLLGVLWGFFLKFLKKSIKNNFGLFSFFVFIPFFWIIFEYFRAWAFEFIWLGKETFFGPHWTFGNLAYSLHKVPFLIQTADMWGIYGISFLIVVINSAIFLIIKNFKEKNGKRLKNFSAYLAILIVFSFLFIYGNAKLKTEYGNEEREIALIQTNFLSGANFNPYHTREVLDTLLGLLQNPEAIKKTPDIIIAPEGMGIVSASGSSKIAKYLLRDFWKPGQIYLENKKITEKSKENKSRLFYYDLEKEEPIGYYEKRLLVPNGDFLPYIAELLSGFFFQDNNKFKERLYQKGEINSPTQTPKGIIGGTICSSILSPEINREMAYGGAEFLAVVSSDSPFHGAKSLLEQNLAMSKFRAVENRKFFAQATNMGHSFVLDPHGAINAISGKTGNEIIFAKITLNQQKTPYTKHGDWFVFAGFIVLAMKLSYPQAKKFLLQRKK